VAGDQIIEDFITPEFRDAFEDGQPVVVNDVTTDSRMRDLAANYRPFGIGAFASVPLFSEKRCKATLSVDHEQARNWPPDELRLLHSVDARLWPAVKRARMAEALCEGVAKAARLAIIQRDDFPNLASFS
jgi:GAF domain-containing protein